MLALAQNRALQRCARMPAGWLDDGKEQKALEALVSLAPLAGVNADEGALETSAAAGFSGSP